MLRRIWLAAFLTVGCASAASDPSARDVVPAPRPGDCDAPPDDVINTEVNQRVEAAIGDLEAVATGEGTFTRKAERIREILPGITSFEILEFRFCRMYEAGRITQEQYVDMIESVLPIVLPNPPPPVSPIVARGEAALPTISAARGFDVAGGFGLEVIVDNPSGRGLAVTDVFVGFIARVPPHMCRQNMENPWQSVQLDWPAVVSTGTISGITDLAGVSTSIEAAVQSGWCGVSNFHQMSVAVPVPTNLPPNGVERILLQFPTDTIEPESLAPFEDWWAESLLHRVWEGAVRESEDVREILFDDAGRPTIWHPYAVAARLAGGTQLRPVEVASPL